MRPEDEDEDGTGLIGVLVLTFAPAILVWAFAIYGFLCRYVWSH